MSTCTYDYFTNGYDFLLGQVAVVIANAAYN